MFLGLLSEELLLADAALGEKVEQNYNGPLPRSIRAHVPQLLSLNLRAHDLQLLNPIPRASALQQEKGTWGWAAWPRALLHPLQPRGAPLGAFQLSCWDVNA